MGSIQVAKHLLLSYVGFLAERHSYGPGDGFEFKLWDDILLRKPKLVSTEEKSELNDLMARSDSWVCFDKDTAMLGIVDIEWWHEFLEKMDS